MTADLFSNQPFRQRKVEAQTEDSPEEFDDLGAFGFLRGVRDKALSLEFRHKDGKITAHSYAWLESAEFDPSEGITLNFSGKIVKLSGRNLNAETRPNVCLFAGILRHRVSWVQEADGPTVMQASETAVFIEEVKIE